MAQLDVEPKKKSNWWLWPLLALIALALIFLLMRSCNEKDDVALQGTSDTTEASGESLNTGANDDWSSINMDAPRAAYDEITDTDIEVRGNDDYAIYSMDETILFDSDQNSIKAGAEEKLKTIAASAEKRFSGGHIRIYGYTDSEGSAGHNKELAQQRAQAVQTWLASNGNITQDRISLNPVGEGNPVASNATEEGKAKNRRVEIVVRKQ